jgi:uncharacterized membrane protein (UPF0127 family)
MRTIDSARLKFSILAHKQGSIPETEVKAILRKLPRKDRLAAVAWLKDRGIKIQKEAVGQQYEQEVVRKLHNPNINDVKDTKHRTHKNKDKYQESKKDVVPVAPVSPPDIVAWMQQYHTQYDNDTQLVEEACKKFGHAEWVYEPMHWVWEVAACFFAVPKEHPEMNQTDYAKDKFKEKKNKEFKTEFYPTWKKFKSKKTAQAFQYPEDTQQQIIQLVEAYGDRIPANVSIPELAMSDDLNIPVTTRIVDAVTRIFDMNTLRSIFTVLNRGVQGEFETTETVTEPLEQAKEFEMDLGTDEPIDLDSSKKDRVVFAGGKTFVVDIANTPMEKAVGLEKHSGLEPNQGMYFPFESPDSVTFHMGAVRFPIDIIFLLEDEVSNLQVGKIIHAAKPGAIDYWSFRNTSAVLELPGGSCQEHGIDVGSTCKFFPKAPTRVE